MKQNLDNTNFNHDGQMLDGEALKNRQTRLNKALNDKDEAEFHRLGGEAELKRVNDKLTDARNKINANQKITADTDPRNTFKKEKGPTDVSVSKATKGADHTGGPKSKIMTNAQALAEEISEIRYLIEYMNNNNKKLKI